MGHDLKFKMAAMPIYGKNHSNDHNQASGGWGKVGKNDAKFPIHDSFELES